MTPRVAGGTLQQWVDACQAVIATPASFYAGARKIVRPWQLTLTTLDSSLTLADAGYTQHKLSSLTRHYLHEESRRAAIKLWRKRRTQTSYGSVGFTCYNHFIKGDVKGASPRGSIFGPCLQSIVITQVDRQTYAVDCFYRTVELFKKFAPDIILLRDVLLPPFDFKGMRLDAVTYHFSSVTAHPMYFVTIVPFLGDPVDTIKKIRDEKFRQSVIKWTANYLCPEHGRGIKKFSQALRVQKDAHARIDKAKLKKLQSFLRQRYHGGDNNVFADPDHD